MGKSSSVLASCPHTRTLSTAIYSPGTMARTSALTDDSTAPAAAGEASGKASWNEEEHNNMLLFMEDHVSEAGDGGNFTDSFFHKVAAHIAPYHTQGPRKTWKMVKTKWAAVRVHTHCQAPPPRPDSDRF